MDRPSYFSTGLPVARGPGRRIWRLWRRLRPSESTSWDMVAPTRRVMCSVTEWRPASTTSCRFWLAWTFKDLPSSDIRWAAVSPCASLYGAPGRVWALVLESASPGIAGAAKRRARVAQDAMLAQRIRNEGVAAFVDHWQSIPLFSSQSRLPEKTRQALRTQRLQHTSEGLANSLQGLGAGMQAPVLHSLPRLQLPVLLLAGELDGKYCGLASQMAAVLPCSSLQFVPAAGHAVHLERPAYFDEAVAGFLQACAPTESDLTS